MKKLTERNLFLACTLGVAVATAAVFIMIAVRGSTYVGEPVLWIRWLEITLSCGFAAWAARMVAKASRS